MVAMIAISTLDVFSSPESISIRDIGREAEREVDRQTDRARKPSVRESLSQETPLQPHKILGQASHAGIHVMTMIASATQVVISRPDSSSRKKQT